MAAQIPPLQAPNEHFLMDNPAMPVVFITVRRFMEGVEETRQITPIRMQYISSVDKADMLEITLADPDYEWIDHKLLQEDLRTEIECRFGYRNNMSPKIKLVFFRQQPRFPSNGEVTTTLVAYDKGVYLMLPIDPKMMVHKDGLTLEQIIAQDLEDLKNKYGVELKVDYKGTKFKGRWRRHPRITGAVDDDNQPLTMMRHLYHLRETVQVDGQEQAQIEVYVDHEGVLHFHPPQLRREPIAVFRYFSDIPGERLLSFEPEVSFQPGKVRKLDVDPDTGNVEEGKGSEATGDRSIRLGEKTVGLEFIDGTIVPVKANGEPAGEDHTVEARVETYIVTGDEGEDPLAYIVEKFEDTSRSLIINANDLDPVNLQLTPGQQLKIPILPSDPDASVREEKAAEQAVAEFLGKRNKAITAKARVLGNPQIMAGYLVHVENVGRKWWGPWYISEATHSIDHNGYFVELFLTRNALMWGEGLQTAAGTPAPFEKVEPTPMKEQKAREALEYVTGAHNIVGASR